MCLARKTQSLYFNINLSFYYFFLYFFLYCFYATLCWYSYVFFILKTLKL
uniref:Uncharacterized protein n=1 Tax=Brugia timori TaxID=42155 RepID=A0A0R3Q3C9_9BILA